MPGKNALILAAALQVPVSLWLTGCKPKTDPQEDAAKEVENSDEKNKDKAKETFNSWFSSPEDRVAQIKKMLADKKHVKFEQRASMYDSKKDKVSALALATYIKESTETGSMGVNGVGWKYDDLVDAQRIEGFMNFQRPMPAVVQKTQMNAYAYGKQLPLLMSQRHLNCGSQASAETLIVESAGSWSEAAPVGVGPGQALPMRNMVFSELYHTGFIPEVNTNDESSFAPKNNAKNFATIYYQFQADPAAFASMCQRAVQMAITINQALSMTVSPEQQNLFDNKAPNAEIDNKYPTSNAWEHYSWTGTEQGPNKAQRNPLTGSRLPASSTKNMYTHEGKLKQAIKFLERLNEHLEDVVLDASQTFPLDMRDGSKAKNQAGVVIQKGNMANYKDDSKNCEPLKVSATDPKQRMQWIQYALYKGQNDGIAARSQDDMTDEHNKWTKDMIQFQNNLDFIFSENKDWPKKPDSGKKYTDKCPEGFEEIFMWDGREADVRKEWTATPTFQDVQIGAHKFGGRHISIASKEADRICLPKCIIERIKHNKQVFPNVDEKESWAEFLEKIQMDQYQQVQGETPMPAYIKPGHVGLATLRDYKIQELEFLQLAGEDATRELNEVMMVAVYQKFVEQKEMRVQTMNSIYLGDAQKFMQAGGYMAQQMGMQTPEVQRSLKWGREMQIESLKFVTLDSMVKEDGVDSLETIAEDAKNGKDVAEKSRRPSKEGKISPDKEQ